ncbi:hypothetical protein ACTFIV_005197 [Dictyostelium citrinum]
MPKRHSENNNFCSKNKNFQVLQPIKIKHTPKMFGEIEIELSTFRNQSGGSNTNGNSSNSKPNSGSRPIQQLQPIVNLPESGVAYTQKKDSKIIKTWSFRWSTTQSNMSSNRRDARSVNGLSSTMSEAQQLQAEDSN